VKHVRWATVVLDCADPESLAGFWSELLDAPATRISDNFYVVRSSTTWLTTLRVPDPQPATWPDGERPKQMHLDIAVTDLDAAVAEAIQLGATQEHVQPAPDKWRVMRDPAGHIFCLLLP
jgi:hypothetical protein